MDNSKDGKNGPESFVGDSSKYFLPTGEIVDIATLVKAPPDAPVTYNKSQSSSSTAKVISKEAFEQYQRMNEEVLSDLLSKKAFDIHRTSMRTMRQSRATYNKVLDDILKHRKKVLKNVEVAYCMGLEEMKPLFRDDPRMDAIMKRLQDGGNRILDFGDRARNATSAAIQVDREEMAANMERDLSVLKIQLRTEKHWREKAMQEDRFFEENAIECVTMPTLSIPAATTDHDHVDPKIEISSSSAPIPSAQNSDPRIKSKTRSDSKVINKSSSSGPTGVQAPAIAVPKSAPKFTSHPTSSAVSRKRGPERSTAAKPTECNTESDAKKVKLSTKIDYGVTALLLPWKLNVYVKMEKSVLVSLKNLLAGFNVEYLAIKEGSACYIVEFAGNDEGKTEVIRCFHALRDQTLLAVIGKGAGRRNYHRELKGVVGVEDRRGMMFRVPATM